MLRPRDTSMFIEMTCSCSASIQIEVSEEQDNMGLVLVNRFSNAHVSCGFMTELITEQQIARKQFNIKITEQDT